MGAGISGFVAVAAIAGAASACVTLPDASYKLYPGPERPLAEVVVLRLGDAGAATVDGRPAARSDWSQVLIAAGEHTIRWQREFGVSALLDPRGVATGGFEAQATLLAGHTYSLRAERSHGTGYRGYFWIVDETTRQVAAGEPKP